MLSEERKIILYGNPITKKNSQRIIYVKNRRMIMPSKRYKEYEKSCGIILQDYQKKWGNPINTPVNMKCLYYMQTRRKVDLTNLLEATCDMLTHYHIIADDNRDIVYSHDGSRVFYDKENPRVEIYFCDAEDYEAW